MEPMTPLANAMCMHKQAATINMQQSMRATPHVPKEMLVATPSLTQTQHLCPAPIAVPLENASLDDQPSPPVLFAQADASHHGSSDSRPPAAHMNDVTQIEEWLRAVGAKRGWQLDLLDGLLQEDLAAVLAANEPCNAEHLGRQHAYNNPIGLQAFVRECAGPWPMEHIVPSDASPHGQEVLDELMQSAQADGILHCPPNTGRHPNADLLRQSFELLSRSAAIATTLDTRCAGLGMFGKQQRSSGHNQLGRGSSLVQSPRSPIRGGMQLANTLDAPLKSITPRIASGPSPADSPLSNGQKMLLPGALGQTASAGSTRTTLRGPSTFRAANLSKELAQTSPAHIAQPSELSGDMSLVSLMSKGAARAADQSPDGAMHVRLAAGGRSTAIQDQVRKMIVSHAYASLARHHERRDQLYHANV
jgi:hypothetical protein